MTETTAAQNVAAAADTRKKPAGTLNSRADRPTSFNLADIPVPHGREEDWRFTPLERMNDLFADELTGTAPGVYFGDTRIDAGGADASALTNLGFKVSHNSECSCLGSIGVPGDRTAVVAWANRGTPTIVRITEAHNEPLVFTINHGEGEEIAAAAQHLVFRFDEGVESTVVLRHIGHARLTQGIEIDVKKDAKVTFVSTQEWDDDAVHASNHRIRLGESAQFKHIVVTLGGDLVRVCTDLQYDGEHADAELLGLYFTDAGQHQEHRLFVDHSIPRCKSRVTYKGALQGQDAHSVWVGDVLIGAKALGTDTYELNRNLVLTKGARADSVPDLEIETGQIEGAGHASATGRFDDLQLFYLQSRGVPEAEARRLVVRGFFAELINQIGVPIVQDRLMDAIEDELQLTMGSER